MKKLFLLLLVFVSLDVIAQPISDLLIKNALDDSEVKMIEDQMRYLNGKPYRLGPIQKMEFRTESNQLDRERQDFALRINPANPWELRSNRLYFKEYRDYLAVQKEMALKESLYERYLLLVELLHYQEMQALKANETELLERYINVLEKQQLSGLFDDKDYVDLKLDQVEKSVEADEIGFEIDNLIHKITTLFPGAAALNFSKIDSTTISPEDVHRFVEEIEIESAPLIVQYYTRRMNLAEHDYNLEKNNINFGFVQAQYQQFRIEQDRKPWSISLGVTIPVFNPNKGDMTKRKMDMFEEQQETLEEQQQFDTRSSYLRQQLRNQVKQYEQTRGKIESLKQSSLASVLNTKYDQNPIMRIRFAQSILKLDELALKLKYKMLLTYVELITVLDLIQQQPLVNYLSKDLKTLKQ